MAATLLIVLAVSGTACSSDREGITLGGTSERTTAGAPATAATRPRSGPRPLEKPVPSWARSVASAAPQPVQVQPVSTVAQAVVKTVAVYPDATGTSSLRTLKNPVPSGAPLVLLVQEQRAGRVRVLLPTRPNGSQGWVRAQDVKLSRHEYRMVVSIGQHTLTVYRGSSMIMKERVGLGRSATPTPGGVFYTRELLRPPNPKGPYGPYAYGLSGHSNALDEFLGGDGQLGIHGTNDPSGLGKAVSHGCIRVRNAAIEKLAPMLPLGVPVQITA